jgi:DNA-directed RNA polymerase subunit M/transcription elongation factor TFIIS
MSPDLLEPSSHVQDHPSRRHLHSVDSTLILSELNPGGLIVQFEGADAPVPLTTFGTVRETCPKCKHNQLRLVLRQANVRSAHLFCDKCSACFDAHYPHGRSALTI